MRNIRIISLLLSITLLGATVFFSIPTKASTLYGDADLSGEIEILDATKIQLHLAKLDTLTDAQLKVAKVSSNSDELSILDASLIQQFIAKLIDKFPIQEDIVNNKITYHFTNNKSWGEVYAYLFNDLTGEVKTAWPGDLLTDSEINSNGETVYSFSADPTQYNRVIFTNGKSQTTDTPLTKANSGYFIQGGPTKKTLVVGMYPYALEEEGTLKYVDLEYSSGYNKQLTIWTPVGYDANDKDKKYSVLYMTDGQNIFGDKSTLSGYEWEVDETVLSLMQNGGDGIIIVGIDNSNSNRDSELTPDLGDVVPDYNYGGFANGTGKTYSDFVVNTVIPYIEANYNTNSVRGIMGSSSGGIEAFYIGMEHMDKFSYIGALSPAFLLYDEETWNSYLSKLDFTETDKLPKVYIHNGNSSRDSLEQELYPNAAAMQGWMEEHGYPSELIRTVIDNEGTHSELFWAVWFPDALTFGLGY